MTEVLDQGSKSNDIYNNDSNAKRPNLSSRLLELPGELLEEIIYKLDCKTTCKARLVCKRFNEIALYALSSKLRKVACETGTHCNAGNENMDDINWIRNYLKALSAIIDCYSYSGVQLFYGGEIIDAYTTFLENVQIANVDRLSIKFQKYVNVFLENFPNVVERRLKKNTKYLKLFYYSAVLKLLYIGNYNSFSIDKQSTSLKCSFVTSEETSYRRWIEIYWSSVVSVQGGSLLALLAAMIVKKCERRLIFTIFPQGIKHKLPLIRKEYSSNPHIEIQACFTGSPQFIDYMAQFTNDLSRKHIELPKKSWDAGASANLSVRNDQGDLLTEFSLT